jgi:hypothetical protein
LKTNIAQVANAALLVAGAPKMIPAYFVIAAQLVAVSWIAELNRLNRNDFR